tara:strand:+ start:49 stop:318 length:270 start_codon:yes stop_codon:yes gene_type:complete
MSKSKELRLLVDKTKKEIVKEIDRIVEWNLDESTIVKDLYRKSKGRSNHNGIFNELFQEASNYIKKTIMEELFHEYTIEDSKNTREYLK